MTASRSKTMAALAPVAVPEVARQVAPDGVPDSVALLAAVIDAELTFLQQLVDAAQQLAVGEAVDDRLEQLAALEAAGRANAARAAAATESLCRQWGLPMPLQLRRLPLTPGQREALERRVTSLRRAAARARGAVRAAAQTAQVWSELLSQSLADLTQRSPYEARYTADGGLRVDR